MQDVVVPVTDEVLAKSVVDSHLKSQPKGANLDDISVSNSQDDFPATARPVDPETSRMHFIHHSSFLLLIYMRNPLEHAAF